MMEVAHGWLQGGVSVVKLQSRRLWADFLACRSHIERFGQASPNIGSQLELGIVVRHSGTAVVRGPGPGGGPLVAAAVALAVYLHDSCDIKETIYDMTQLRINEHRR